MNKKFVQRKNNISEFSLVQDASYAGENPHIVVSEARDSELKFKPGINFENIKNNKKTNVF